nr:uncharacterized protein LOC119184004 [Rhipicephalus microplus]
MSNGMVERFHRQLKAALTAPEEHNWVEALPLILLGIRSTLKEDMGCSAAELVLRHDTQAAGRILCARLRGGTHSLQQLCTSPMQRHEQTACRTSTAPRVACGARRPTAHIVPMCLYDTTQFGDLFSQPMIDRFKSSAVATNNSQSREAAVRRLSLDSIKPAHMNRDDAVLPPLRESLPGPPAPMPAQVHEAPSRLTHRGRLSRAPTRLDL